MTLSEAARSGRNFHRKSDPGAWYYLNGKDIRRVEGDLSSLVAIDAEMLTALDWEPEPLKLELTAEDLIRASRGLEDIAGKRRLSGVEFAKLLAKELGLLEAA